MPDELLRMFRTQPASLSGWIDTAITLTDTDNYYGTPVIPAGVLQAAHCRQPFT
ncbi:MAG: hypothetical protein MZV63_08195 [Marinilabiliales bacterium]|nr:hypothetical protein [Marinilabiliales bacterium]